jgi:D-alanine-D-alanine ligase
MIRIGLLYGGRSGEHDVSLCSAASVYLALDRSKYDIVPVGVDRDGRWYVQKHPEVVEDRDFGRKLKIEKKGKWLVNHFEEGGCLVLTDVDNGERIQVDVVFPVMHGTNCEDGTLQGLLELSMVPYVGADVIGSAIGMDKDVAKRLLAGSGIPVVPWITISAQDWENERRKKASASIEKLGLPLFVKPANAGSSVGIRKAKDLSGLESAIDFALQYDGKILVEKAVDCREIECSVIGNEDPEASVLGEVIPKHEFYSYEAKYIDPDGAALKIPAGLEKDLSDRIRKTAVDSYKILCCSGMARVDFFLDKSGGSFYLNEINTLPGFTSISMYPKLWEQTGLSYSRLLDKLIDLACKTRGRKLAIRTVI